jgi:transcriptional regulator with XRE-family HTH domain
MENINSRISEVITALKLSKNQFSKEIGTSSAMISKITGDKTNFGIEIIEKIVSKYPQLNFNWILTGFGEMWLQNHNYKAQEHPQLSVKERILKLADEEKQKREIRMESPSNDDNYRKALQIANFWGKVFETDKELDKTITALNELESLKMDLSIYIDKLNLIPNKIDYESKFIDFKELMSDENIKKTVEMLAPLKLHFKNIDDLNNLITSVLIFLEKEEEK